MPSHAMPVGEEAGYVIDRPIIQDMAIVIRNLAKKFEDFTAIVHDTTHSRKSKTF